MKLFDEIIGRGDDPRYPAPFRRRRANWKPLRGMAIFAAVALAILAAWEGITLYHQSAGMGEILGGVAAVALGGGGLVYFVLRFMAGLAVPLSGVPCEPPDSYRQACQGVEPYASWYGFDEYMKHR